MTEKSLLARREIHRRNARVARLSQIIWFVYLVAGLPIILVLEAILGTPANNGPAGFTVTPLAMPPAVALYFFGLVLLTLSWWAFSWFGVPRIALTEWCIVTVQASCLTGVAVAGGWLEGYAPGRIWPLLSLFGSQLVYVWCAVFLIHWLNTGPAAECFRMKDPTSHWLLLSLCPPLVVPVGILLLLFAFAGAPFVGFGIGCLAFAIGVLRALFCKELPSRRSYRRRGSGVDGDREKAIARG
jgi:hypothetical protein